MVIDGRKIADDILRELKARPAPTKILTAIVVGDNPATASFIRQKEKTAAVLGIKFQLHRLTEDVITETYIELVKKLCADNKIGGVILQWPLPSSLAADSILAALTPEKDVDALIHRDRVLPPAAAVLRDILKVINFNLSNRNIVVVGHGFLVGRPIADWLKNAGAIFRVFEIDSDPEDFKKSLANADLIISGVGKAGLIKSSDLKNGAIVIDFGYDFVNGKLSGDLEMVDLNAIFYTPTPGGTGPILVAELFKNFYDLNS